MGFPASASGRAPVREAEGQRPAILRWVLPLAAIVALGLALRLLRLDAASFWADEMFSAWWIGHDLGFLWSEGMRLEPNPPLYYTLLKGWTALAGARDEVAVRSFSVFCSVVTIPVVALIGRDVAGWRAGLLAAALFAVAPVQVHYAQEGRTYALLILLTATALLGMMRFVRGAQHGGGARQWLVLYAVAAVAMVYSHATAALTLAALNICAAAWLFAAPARRRAVVPLVGANLVVLLLAAPQILTMLGYMGRTHELGFIAEPGLVEFLNLANVLLVDPNTPWFAFRVASLTAAMVAGLFALVLVFVRPAAEILVFLVAVPALFLVLALLAGLVAPVLMPRVLTWMSVPFCVLAAAALLSPRPPMLLRAAFALALAFATILGQHGVHARAVEVKDDWRGLAATLRQRIAQDDLLVFSAGAGIVMLHVYGPEGVAQRIWVPSGTQYSPFLQLGSAPQPTTDEEIARAAGQGRRVRLVLWAPEWERHGAAALEIVPARSPEIDRRHARLVLLTW